MFTPSKPAKYKLLTLTLALVSLGGCGEPEEPILELSASPTLERPTANCEAEFSVNEGDVFYVVHALPAETGRNLEDLGDLEVSVATACTEVTKSFSHDDDGLVSIPFEAPVGAECGVVVTASIANSTKTCQLDSASSSPCAAECPIPEGNGDGDGDGEPGDSEPGDGDSA